MGNQNRGAEISARESGRTHPGLGKQHQLVRPKTHWLIQFFNNSNTPFCSYGHDLHGHNNLYWPSHFCEKFCTVQRGSFWAKSGFQLGTPQDRVFSHFWTPKDFPQCSEGSGTLVGSWGKSLAPSSLGGSLGLRGWGEQVVAEPSCFLVSKMNFTWDSDCEKKRWAPGVFSELKNDVPAI